MITRVLVMTTEDDSARVIAEALDDAETVVVAGPAEARAQTRDRDFDLVFVEVDILRALAERDDPGSALAAVARLLPGARVVVLSPPTATREAVAYVRDGAADYLTCPVVPEEVALVRHGIERRERLRSELRYLRDRALATDTLGAISSRAEAMKDVLHKIRQVAPTRSTVLLTGETGTGKSFLARVIHQHSNRAERQFISVHCGAIPDSLLESELFGHERGAYTGADRRRLGKFEIANGGTILLDEVATVTPAMQVKLLDVLQERRLQRVGGEHAIEVDVRILAASNVDLPSMTERGEFRADLFYRLNVFPIEVPPLRERLEDLPLLVTALLDMLCRSSQREAPRVHPEVMAAFASYSWPGNVRELENLLERALILERSDELPPACFPDEIFGAADGPGTVPIRTDDTLADARSRAVAEIERRYLERQLAANRGRVDVTARAAGITPRQLRTLMSKHGLKKERYRNVPRS